MVGKGKGNQRESLAAEMRPRSVAVDCSQQTSVSSPDWERGTPPYSYLTASNIILEVS